MGEMNSTSEGSIVGAAIVIALNQLVLVEISRVLQLVKLPPRFDPTQYQQLIYGVILIAMMIVRPKGLVPAKRNPAKLENLEHGELAKGVK